MKFLRLVKKQVLPVAIVLSLVAPNGASIVNAKGADIPDIHREDFSPQEFVPFRCGIPSYLIQHSGDKGETIKKLWAKLFYEEKYWDENHETFYDSNYSTWMDKYSDKYFSILDSKEKNLLEDFPDKKLAFTTGDFEAAFGATIKNNPEFLGQLLGLPGYEPLGNSADGNAYMKEVVSTYLKEPDKYKYFSKYIVELTSDGSYIGDSMDSENNILNIGNDKTNSLNMLATLGHFYGKKNGDEYILSDEQIRWVESFQRYLYDEYVNTPDTSLAKKDPAIYNMIARSEDAANNRGGKGQEFFDYVEKSNEGIGEWLNQIEGFDMEELKRINSLALLFTMAEGYCYGNEPESKCTVHKDCLPIDDGGKATELDEIAYKLHKIISSNSLLNRYIKGNADVYKMYQTDEESYVVKFNVHHDKTGASLYFNKTVVAGSGGNNSASDQKYTDYSQVTATASCEATLVVSSAAFLTNARSITVQCYCSTTGGIYAHGVYANGVDLTPRCPRNGSTINISDLTKNERANAVMYIVLKASDTKSYNAVTYNEKHTAYTLHGGWAQANAVCYSNAAVIVSCRRSDCVIYGHHWRTNSEHIKWADDLKSATLVYSCKKDVAHETSEITVPVEAKEEDDRVVYTISAYPYVYKMIPKTDSSGNILKDEGGETVYEKTSQPDSYSKTVLKSKTSSETITLGNSNVSGATCNKGIGRNTIYANGSLSQANKGQIFKEASTAVSFTINPGLIKSGAKSIKINAGGNPYLSSLGIYVYSQYGELLASNESSSNPTTVYLSRFTDDNLYNCKVYVYASAFNKTYTSNYWTAPADAVAEVWVGSIQINY
ncbi:MAG: hypothetical protein IKW81_07140 [Pseudobutyrivibrio sp.]|nr:hypothetical protein [Pseudobutyrivibrio sp.]